MPNLYDPQRRRTGDLPQLNGFSGFAVPRLTIWPTEDGAIRISAMIPVAGEGYTAREVSARILTYDLPAIVAQYRFDPERFLETFFNIKLNGNSVSGGPKDVPATKIRRAAAPISSADIDL